MWLKTWNPFLRWPNLRTDVLEPLKHVRIALCRAREPEKRTANSLGCRICGDAAAASAPPFFEWALALATTSNLEDEHAVKANATASNNAVRPRKLINKA
jgi:hypothetical protein